MSRLHQGLIAAPLLLLPPIAAAAADEVGPDVAVPTTRTAQTIRRFVYILGP